jgi:signal transduction histidine kinase
VGAAISLKLARKKWSGAPDEAGRLVDAALEQLEAGIRGLRDLAAGIHPSILSDRGLGAALKTLATRSAVPVELGPLPPQRFPSAVEATAYFVVAEALTNAAKHARCKRAEVAVRIENGHAVVEVRDDGVGGADASRGSGLRGLADRVSALGGGLDIESRAGEGTTITALLALPAQEAAPHADAEGDGGSGLAGLAARSVAVDVRPSGDRT